MDKQQATSEGVRGCKGAFVISPAASAWKCVAFLVIGIGVCWLGWMLMDVSTGWDAINLRSSEYLRIYGCDTPSAGKWLLFLIGATIDLCGIAYAYHAWERLLGHIKRPAWKMSPPVAKTVAVVVCAVFFILFVLILGIVKGVPSGGQKNMSVWDYLIMIAGFKAIWQFFVGAKKEMPRNIGSGNVENYGGEIKNDISRHRNGDPGSFLLMIKSFVITHKAALAIAAVTIIICALLMLAFNRYEFLNVNGNLVKVDRLTGEAMSSARGRGAFRMIENYNATEKRVDDIRQKRYEDMTDEELLQPDLPRTGSGLLKDDR